MSALLAQIGPNFQLAWPLVLLLLPLPWLLALLPGRGEDPASDAGAGAIRLPFADALATTAMPPAMAARRERPGLLGSLIFALIVLAAARPQWIDPVAARPVSGRDLLLLLDVSASMQTRDLKADGVSLSRLAAATRVGRRFLEARPGDRAGLIIFASRPYVYAPLTYDLPAVGTALGSAEVGLAGEQTALGDALALAVKTLSNQSGDSRKGGEDSASGQSGQSRSNRVTPPAGAVAVLVSDGANTAGTLSPQQAAWLASQRQVRVHALGVGSGADETALRTVAEQTGGTYALATDAAGVSAFFARIDQLEPALRAVDSGEPGAASVREFYVLPLALAALLLVLQIMLPPSGWRQTDRGAG